jgi:radical SAM-linked protein
MAPDSTFPTIAPILTPDSPSRSKFRVRFCKSGDLRLVSHHDLMHVFERMFRRADLPIPTTQGFNPRPRMWFALSLALGIAGLNEVLEFEVAEPLSASEVERRLIAQCPPGLVIVSLRAIDVKASAHVRRGWYRLTLPQPIADLSQRCQAFLQRGEFCVERVRPQRRRINIRPYVDELRCAEDHLAMALWITPNGAARPEEIIAALGLQELLDAGAVIERTDLEIYDELPPGVTGPPVMQAAHEETGSNDGILLQTPVAARPTAIIDSPFSFDS